MTPLPTPTTSAVRHLRVALLLLAWPSLLTAACEARDDREQPPANMQRGTVERVTSDAVAWRRDHDAALAHARQAGKPVMIDFYADWCAPCIELDAAFADPQVTELLNARFVAIKVDGTESTEAIRPLMDRYGVEAFPAVIFLDAQGNTLPTRFDDAVAPQRVLETLRGIAPDTGGP